MAGRRYVFADIALDTESGEVTVEGRPVPLSPRLRATLRVLVEHANEPVSREAILAAVWPDTHVVPNSVAQAIVALRRALAGSAGGWRIEALPGVGYRLVATIEDSHAHRDPLPWRRLVAAAAAVMLAAAGTWWSRDLEDRRDTNASARLVDRAAELLSSRRAGDLTQARHLFASAAALDSRNATALTGFAESRYLESFYGVDSSASAIDDARRAASRAIALDSGAARAYAVRASIALDRDWDLASSNRDFRRALSLDEIDALTQLWSAWGCLGAGLLPEARAAVDRAVALDPFSASILTARATFAYLAGDFEAAVAESRRVLHIDPTYFRAHLRLGLALLAAGQPDVALAHLQTAHRLEPDVPETTSALAHAYAVTARTADAERMLEREDARLPSYDRALVLTGLGRRAEAVTELHTARARHQLVAGLYAAEPRLSPLEGLEGFRALDRSGELPDLPGIRLAGPDALNR
jgi:DNA-binding winged helix-turn-helix (wHTH) protein/Flp pilus assembly protein TadD